jgi:hypothetical protein
MYQAVSLDAIFVWFVCPRKISAAEPSIVVSPKTIEGGFCVQSQ